MKITNCIAICMVLLVVKLRHSLSTQATNAQIVMAEIGDLAEFPIPKPCIKHGSSLVHERTPVAKFSSIGSVYYNGGRLTNGCYEQNEHECAFYMPVKDKSDEGMYHLTGDRTHSKICDVMYMLAVESEYRYLYFGADHGTPYRIGGSVRIFLNGKDYHQADMFGLILPSVGRFLITFSTSTKDVAKSLMLTASHICEFLGWIVAAPKCKGNHSVNHTSDANYMYTRYARIHYEDGSVTSLYQNFTSTSVKDEYIMVTIINGTTPKIPKNISMINIEDYQPVYVQTQSGLWESNFTSSFISGNRTHSTFVNQFIYYASNDSQLNQTPGPTTLKISNIHIGYANENRAVTVSMKTIRSFGNCTEEQIITESHVAEKGYPVEFILSVTALTSVFLCLAIGIVIGSITIYRKVIRRIRFIKDKRVQTNGLEMTTIRQGKVEAQSTQHTIDDNHYEEIPDAYFPLIPSQSIKSGCSPTKVQNQLTGHVRNTCAIPPDDHNYDYISHVNQAHEAALTTASRPDGDYIHPIYHILNNKDYDNDERSTEYGNRSFLCLSSSIGDSSEQDAVTSTRYLEKSNETDSITNVKTIFSSNDEDNENNVNETALKEVAEVDSNTLCKELYDSNSDSAQINEEVDAQSTDSGDLAFVQHRQKADPNTYSKF